MASAACAAARCARARRPRFTLGEVFRRFGPAYRAAHRLPLGHLHVMRAVESCRTAALGGHLERCASCGYERPSYDSCRNRHCPTCQSLARAQWLEARERELLPVPYSHAVFTLPHELNPLVLVHLRPLVHLLFTAASQTLLTFGRNELGGTLGFVAVLHTWDPKLRDHFHLHCLVAAGALAPEGSRWIASRPDYLFPERALAVVFRAKFLEGLKALYGQGRLSFPGQTAALATPGAFQGLVDTLFAKPWITYLKPPLAGPSAVLDYLARYTHRVALSNDRILGVTDDAVTLAYRDRKRNRPRRVPLKPEEFIRRFLLHVLPKGLQRIRHFGFLANRAKRPALKRCRVLLGPVSPPPAAAPMNRALLLALAGIDPQRCPRCHEPTFGRAGRLPAVSEPGPLCRARAPPLTSQEHA